MRTLSPHSAVVVILPWALSEPTYKGGLQSRRALPPEAAGSAVLGADRNPAHAAVQARRPGPPDYSLPLVPPRQGLAFFRSVSSRRARLQFFVARSTVAKGGLFSTNPRGPLENTIRPESKARTLPPARPQTSSATPPIQFPPPHG